MIKEYPLQDTIQWDCQNWGKALPHWEKVLPNEESPSITILAIGERHGGLSLWLAGRKINNVCSDYHMEFSKARDLHKKYAVEQFVTYQKADIFNLPFESNSFDYVVCKSVIGGLKLDNKDRHTRTLENQKLAIREIFRVLKPGGYYLGAENMSGSLFHKIIRTYTGKSKGWRYLAQDELHFLLSDFENRDIKYYGFIGTFWKIKILNKINSFIDVVLSSILPSSLLYIGIFSAKKPIR